MAQASKKIDPPPAYAPNPRLFEIGRTGAIDITDCHDSCEEVEAIHGQLDYIQSSSSVWNRLGAGFFVLGPLLGLTVVTFMMTRRLDRRADRFRHRAHRWVSLLGCASSVLLALFIWFYTRPGYEPWPFFEGVSSVPTLVLQITTIVFSISFVAIALGRVAQGDRDASNNFGLPHRTAQRIVPQLSDWKHSSLFLGKREKKGEKPIERIWESYLANSACHARLPRLLIPVVLVSFIIVFLVVPMDKDPLLSRHLDPFVTSVRGVMIFAVLSTVFFWSDALKLERSFIRDLAWYDIVGLKNEGKGHEELDAYVSQRWRTMDLVVRRTEIVGPIIVLPFLLLPLLMLARSTVFEGWVWTLTILAIYAVLAVYMLVQALRFQFEADKAKRRILDDLDVHRHKLAVADEAVQSKRLEMVIKEINDIHEGAFVPWTRHPILQSVALPSGGLGLITLLDLLF